MMPEALEEQSLRMHPRQASLENYLPLPPSSRTEPGLVPSMDEVAFNFVMNMINKLQLIIQQRWNMAEVCIQEIPSLGLVHKMSLEEEFHETVHRLRLDASQLLVACGIDEEELGSTKTDEPPPQSSEPSAMAGTLRILLSTNTLMKA